MAFYVQKFGGTSVGSPERIQAVARRIAASHKKGDRLVVVISAMGHTTDELLALAHRVSKQPPHREMDMLLTAGERISMALLSMALADLGVQAISFTGSQSGIITDESHRRARIKRVLGDRVKKAIEDHRVAIVAGFQGVSESKEITTLGRGGSDTTAVAMAAALKADTCEIYTDVDGVYSADPRIVPGARIWPKISYDTMLEMAFRGAGVLHPRCVALAKKNRISLRVLNSMRENGSFSGTEICDLVESMETSRVIGITADSGRALVSLELTRATVLSALWSEIEKNHFSVLTPLFQGTKLWFFVEKEFEKEWEKLLSRLVRDGYAKEYRFESNIVPLTVVADAISQDAKIFNQVLDTLASHGVPVTIAVSSSLTVTVAVPMDWAQDGVRFLHDQFFGEKK